MCVDCMLSFLWIVSVFGWLVVRRIRCESEQFQSLYKRIKRILLPMARRGTSASDRPYNRVWTFVWRAVASRFHWFLYRAMVNIIRASSHTPLIN